MKITVARTQEKVDLLKSVVSKDKAVAMKAQESLAALIGSTIDQVLPLLNSSALVYEDFAFDHDSDPSIPLDLFEDVDEGYIKVWSQSIAGGMPTNLIHGMGEYKFTTYRLDSAISFLNRYAKDARLDVLAKGIERMAQEIAVKQEYNAWATLLKAAADGTDNAGNPNTLAATTAGVFQIDDLNRIITKQVRLFDAWNGGTPAKVNRKGVTDFFVSPEIMEDIRAFAYQPMNTRAVPDTAESTALGLPDRVREKFFGNAGVPELYGKAFHELLELGVAKSYGVLFDSFYSGSPTFDNATQDLVIGADLSAGAFLRPVSLQPTQDIDVSSQVVTMVDDQFLARQEQFGFYTKVEEGRVVLDNKSLFCLFV